MVRGQLGSHWFHPRVLHSSESVRLATEFFGDGVLESDEEHDEMMHNLVGHETCNVINGWRTS
eukprot:8739442-Alexandrium_andersonii.AAC.1